MRKGKQNVPAEENWGIPDFRKPAQYPTNFNDIITREFEFELKQKQHTLKQMQGWGWRWEFLRRTDEYRNYWKKYKGRPNQKDYFHPAFQLSRRLPDPREPFSRKIKFEDFKYLGIEGGRHRRIYMIDFSFRLEPQLERIIDHARLTEKRMSQHGALFGTNVDRKNLRKKQRKRTLEEDLNMFLRALDARAAGITYGEIAEVIERKSSSIGDKALNLSGSRLYKSALKFQKLTAQIYQPTIPGQGFLPPIRLEKLK